MHLTFDANPVLAAVLATVISCAHGGPAPSATRIPIAVATIGFGPDNGLTPEEQAECELGKELFEELHDEVGQSFALSGVTDPRGVPGVVLVMRFARVEGQGFASGIKRVVLEGQLVKDGQVTADFVAMRYTTRGAFGDYSRGFKTTCGIMEDVVEELAEDVGAWLYRPMMNARLGDLGPARPRSIGRSGGSAISTGDTSGSIDASAWAARLRTNFGRTMTTTTSEAGRCSMTSLVSSPMRSNASRPSR